MAGIAPSRSGGIRLDDVRRAAAERKAPPETATKSNQSPTANPAEKTSITTHTINDVTCRTTLYMPCGKPGLDMYLDVKVVSIASGAIYGRRFTMSDLRGLCAVLISVPDILLLLLERPPAIIVHHDFRVAVVEYTFELQTNLSHYERYTRVVVFNLEEVRTKEHEAAIASIADLNAALIEERTKALNLEKTIAAIEGSSSKRARVAAADCTPPDDDAAEAPKS